MSAFWKTFIFIVVLNFGYVFWILKRLHNSFYMRFGISQNDWKTEKMGFRNFKTILFLKPTKDENKYFTRFYKKNENDKSFKLFFL